MKTAATSFQRAPHRQLQNDQISDRRSHMKASESHSRILNGSHATSCTQY
jgi:hypothetical protein